MFPNYLVNIQLEYEESENYLEIEITPNKEMFIYEENKEIERETFYSNVDYEIINKKLNKQQ